MDADSVTIEWDEKGFMLNVVASGEFPFSEIHEDGSFTFRITDPEQLYDRVKAAILPWLMERDEALREYRAGMALARDVEADAREAYDPSDPKHPDWHSVHADIWDAREGK